VYADLKWERLDLLEKDILELYLRRALLVAYADLAAGGARKIQLAVTYPLAFDANRLAVMKSALENVLRSLEARTGIAADTIRYFSESHAGIAAIENVFAEYTLTVDMGGGTTDFALLRGSGDAEVAAAESVRIGGRDILKTLSKQQDAAALGQRLNNALGAPTAARLGVPTETLMETVLQSSGVNALIAAVLPNQTIAVRQSGIALLAGVVLVAKRVLEAELARRDDKSPPTINVALLGQAWHLLRPELNTNLTETLVMAVLKKILAGRCTVQPVGVQQDPRGRKLALARGAMKLLERGARSPDSRPLVPLGMSLRANSRELPATSSISEMPSGLAFSSGDPGFAQVIDDLLLVMGEFAVSGLAIGDPKAWLSASAPGITNQSREDHMIAQGCHVLSDELVSGQGTLSRSPLALFLSGPWRQAWLAD
jgi:hypothetical protein